MKARKKQKSLKGIKVLLVEDDDFLSEILRTKLSDDGGILSVYTSAQEALRAIEQNAPDVVVSDLMLPGMSGEELVDKIKSSQSLKNIPIIIFSNKSNPDEIKTLLAKGVAQYHVKSQTSLKDIPEIIMSVLC